MAARKCRAKKLNFVLEMENQARELNRRNEELRVQLATLQKMFSRCGANRSFLPAT